MASSCSAVRTSTTTTRGAPPEGRLQEPNPFPKSLRNNVAQGYRVRRFDGDVEDRVEQAL
jgi:hypothetical protein